LTFVRAEVWQLREERKERKAYLASLPYSDAEKKKIEAYRSKFAEDAEFINAFINEVGRNQDTAAALKAGTPPDGQLDSRLPRVPGGHCHGASPDVLRRPGR
jgi:hypothetical protein